MNEFELNVVLKPDGKLCKYTGVRRFTTKLLADSLEQAKDFVKQTYSVLLVDGVEILFE
jgi:hypothetical protein